MRTLFKVSFEFSFLSNRPEMVQTEFKDHVEKIIEAKNDLIIIIKRHKDKKIEFIELSSKDTNIHKNLIISEFTKLKENRQNLISNVYENYTVEQKDLEKFTKEMDIDTIQEYEKSNCYMLINETASQIQKFRDNPTEDHVMINNFIGLSNLQNDNQKISMHTKDYQ